MDLKGEEKKPSRFPAQIGETFFERALNFYVIPEDTFMSNWDRFMVLVAIVNAILSVFMAAFQYHSPAAWVFAYLVDLMFFGDIYVKFHNAYLQGGFWVVFPREMAQHYMNSHEFIFDVVSNLPVDILCLIWVNTQSSGQVQVYLAIVRLWKLLRTGRILMYFRRQEQKLHASFGVQVVKFVTFLSVLEHTMACIWFAIACRQHLDWDAPGVLMECKVDSWIVKNGFTDHGLSSAYIDSLYWAVTTMTTTGYGDITPGNDLERVIGLIAMTMGIVFYGYVSGTVASTLSNMDSKRVSYQQKLEAIKQYMLDRQMDMEMQQRVLHYYDYVWERNRGIDVKNVFGDMPSTFMREVALSLNNEIIDNAAIFKECSLGFRRMVATDLKLYLFTANEFVVHSGDLGLEMYFITQGRIDIFAEGDKRPTASLIEGGHFGEYGVTFGYRHEYSAQAVCNTDIYVLTAVELAECFEAYPDDKVKVMAECEKRYKAHLNAKKSRKAMTTAADDLEDEFAVGGAMVPLGEIKLGGSRNAMNTSSLEDQTAVPKPTRRRMSVATAGYAILDQNMAAARSNHDLQSGFSRRSQVHGVFGKDSGSKNSLRRQSVDNTPKQRKASIPPFRAHSSGTMEEPVPPVPPLPASLQGHGSSEGVKKGSDSDVEVRIQVEGRGGRASKTEPRASKAGSLPRVEHSKSEDIV